MISNESFQSIENIHYFLEIFLTILENFYQLSATKRGIIPATAWAIRKRKTVMPSPHAHDEVFYE